MTDQELVGKVLKGDQSVFGVLIKNTEGLVAQILFRMIRQPEDRKDLAQDIYLKVFKGLKSFRFQSRLSTWVAQITYNTCISYLEKKKIYLTHLNLNEDENQEERLDHLINQYLPEPLSDVENSYSKKERMAILASSLETLNPVYKTIVVLFHQEELKYEEISEITGLPIGTVKSYLFRARKSLRENLLLKYQKEEL